MSTPRPNRSALVWAIDPYEPRVRPSAALIQELGRLAGRAGLSLQPTYALIGDERERSELVRNAEETCRNYLRDAAPIELPPAEVVYAGAVDRERETRRLAEVARERHSPCVAVTSHGRYGVSRFVLGSFAEKLLRESPLPVLFLVPEEGAAERITPIRRALFATDFSDASEAAFLRFLPEAQRLGLEISLYHSVYLPAVALASNVGAPTPIPERYFSEQVAWARGQAAGWTKLAAAAGVPLRFAIEDDGVNEHVAEGILAAARREEAGLVVMASTSRPLENLFLGSAARGVFRARKLPVWVYGPRALQSE